jgi:hypothetical protein
MILYGETSTGMLGSILRKELNVKEFTERMAIRSGIQTKIKRSLNTFHPARISGNFFLGARQGPKQHEDIITAVVEPRAPSSTALLVLCTPLPGVLPNKNKATVRE